MNKENVPIHGKGYLHNPAVSRRKRTFVLNIKKLVPFTEVEWRYVQNTFLSDELKDLKQMVDLMSMWICRMQHDTPMIIEISELVLRALVLDLKHQQPKGESSSLDIADSGLIHGSVIIRFVNYVNEVCQPDGGHVLSIAHAVSKVGIPSWIVNIRHQATHGQMPPMNLMKEAIKFCRKWLWSNHWSRSFNEAIKETLPRAAVEQKREEQRSTTGHKMVTCLNRFREWRKKYRNMDQFHFVEGQPQDKLRNEFENLLELSPDDFIPFYATSCLARKGVDGNLADESNLELTMIDSVDEGAGVPLLDGDVMSCEKYIDNISGLEQNYHRPIFELINSKGCLQRLLTEMTRLIAQNELEFGELRRLAGWSELLLYAYLRASDTVSMRNWRNVLKHMVLAPQFFRDEHIYSVLNVLGDNISELCRKRLVRLLKIRHINMPLEPSTSLHSLLEMSMNSVKSLGDLQSRIRAEEHADCSFVRDPLTLEEAWSLAQPDELGPMGLTADQRADTLCLTLGNDDLWI